MTKDRRNGLYGLIAQVMAENPEISAGRTMSGIRRYGPWQCKHRPAGDWVIDQLDRQTLKVRRFGTFKTEAEALEACKKHYAKACKALANFNKPIPYVLFA